MSNQRHYKLLSIAILFSVNGFGLGDPVGQMADYTLDKNPARTSTMIQSGKMKASVVAFHEVTTLGAAYEIDLDYKFNVVMVGTKEGKESRMVEKEFFSEEFMKNLREKKHYEGAYFKANHLGYADVKNLDGKMYPHCDKIELYDLTEPPQFVRDLFSHAFGVPYADIEDLKALVHYYDGVPVLGGAKIDVNGTYNGMFLKAGGDYVAKR